MMRYYNYMCSHSLGLVLNDKRQSDDLRDDGNLFHSEQAFGTKRRDMNSNMKKVVDTS